MISHGKRWKYAFRVFWSLIVHGRIADDILDTFRPRRETQPAPAAAAAAENADRAIQLLALFQRDGRLVDFLMEDLAGYADAQVGAAVRDVHAGCRTSLTRYVTLEPVLHDPEGAAVTLNGPVDPARVKVIGSHTPAVPYRGVLRHRGWQASRVDLPPLPTGVRTVVAPAELEVQ